MISNINNLSDEEFINIALKKFPITEQGSVRRFKYRMTNRNITDLNSFCGELGNKNILAASGSSIPLFSFLSRKDCPAFVYGFDYSPKQITYNYLVKYAIKNLSLREYRDFFGFEKKQRRNQKNREIRRLLVSKIPTELRKYLTREHELTNRDIKLSKFANCSFFTNETEYNQIRKNINKVKFFVFNLNPVFRQELTSLFPDKYFDLVYLSNVLDWICWHNKVKESTIDNILCMLGNTSNDTSYIVVDHLAKRITLLSDYLQKSNIIDKSSYDMYIYYWEMYKLKTKRGVE